MWGNGTISLSVRVGNTVFSFLQSDGEMDVVGEFGERWAKEILHRCGNVLAFFPLRRGAKEGKVSRFSYCVQKFEYFYLAVVIFISSDLSCWD